MMEPYSQRIQTSDSFYIKHKTRIDKHVFYIMFLKS